MAQLALPAPERVPATGVGDSHLKMPPKSGDNAFKRYGGVKVLTFICRPHAYEEAVDQRSSH